MMQFLKSILLRSSAKNREAMNLEELKEALNNALYRIEVLESQAEQTNEALVELSSCVKNIAFATQSLSHEVTGITTLIQQAADMAQRDSGDLLKWSHGDNDDDGYLN